jgi:iron complex transport system substrate-binding protein
MEKMDPRFPAIKGDDSFSQSEFNIEEAASLNPDLILANARSSWLESAAELDIPVFLFDPETPERLKEAVFLTGQIFGPHSTAQANAWVKYFEGVMEKIGIQANNIPDEDKLDVLFTGTEPLRVVSGEMFQTFIIETVGGHSVTSGLGGYWNNVNLEQVLLWAPDVVIVPPYGGASVEAITESQEWQILDAVKEGRVYRMPKLVAPWDTPAPDAVLGVIWMGQQLYPEKYDLECTQEAEYFYNTFFDYKITEEELATVCNFE